MDWDDDSIDDLELAAVEVDLLHEDSRQDALNPPTNAPRQSSTRKGSKDVETQSWKPQMLPNGNWKCNHTCKDKQACNHKCCVSGLKNKPKPPKAVKQSAGKGDGNDDDRPMGKVQDTALKHQAKLSFDYDPGLASSHGQKRGLDQVDLTEAEAAPAKLPAKKRIVEQKKISRHPPEPSARPTPAASPSDNFEDFDDISDFEDFDAVEIRPLKPPKPMRPPQESRSLPDELYPIHDEPIPISDGVLVIEKLTYDDRSDEDMLEAALIGAEDSYDLSSPQEVPFDQPPSFQQAATRPRDSVKATVPLKGDVTNAVRQAEGEMSNGALSKQGEEATDRAELQAFLWQEFGDIVELI